MITLNSFDFNSKSKKNIVFSLKVKTVEPKLNNETINRILLRHADKILSTPNKY